jgi:hypothetical protein
MRYFSAFQEIVPRHLNVHFDQFYYMSPVVEFIKLFVRFEVFTVVTMKNGVIWDVAPCVALVRTDVSEELSASIIKAKTIGELGTTLARNSSRRSLRRNTTQRPSL